MNALVQPKPSLRAVVDELVTYFDTREAIEDPQQLAEFDAEYKARITELVQNKTEAITFVWQQLERSQEACREDARALYDRARQLEEQHERLKAYIVETLENAGLKKIEVATGGVRLHPSTGVEIENEDAVPVRFRNFTVTINGEDLMKVRAIPELYEIPAFDMQRAKFEDFRRAEIRRVIDAGGEVPGATVKPKNSAVLIKPKAKKEASAHA